MQDIKIVRDKLHVIGMYLDDDGELNVAVAFTRRGVLRKLACSDSILHFEL